MAAISTRKDRAPAHKITIKKILFVFNSLILAIFVIVIYATRQQTQQQTQQQSSKSASPSLCAINLWGLPRAFEALVLPSLIQNVVKPNLKYNCDYYVHYFNITDESQGRSGQGGQIRPDEILHFKTAISAVAQGKMPIVDFDYTTMPQFIQQYSPLLDKIQNTKDSKGRYLYFPWKAKTYKHPDTTDNIVKMWHTIQSSFNLMLKGESQHQRQYTQVAMIRSDVVYVTPFDIYKYHHHPSNTGNNEQDINANNVVIPGFGRHPLVNDRLVYGPRDLVKIWATQRFDRLESHVQYILENDPGWGMHSERFVQYALLKQNYIYDDELCFLRARADESVWTSDCEGGAEVSLPSISKKLGNVKAAVERTLGRKCGKETWIRKNVRSLDCKR